MANLRVAFGSQIDEARLAEIADESYRQIAMSFMELLIAPKLQKQIRTMLQSEQAALFRKFVITSYSIHYTKLYEAKFPITLARA